MRGPGRVLVAALVLGGDAEEEKEEEEEGEGPSWWRRIRKNGDGGTPAAVSCACCRCGRKRKGRACCMSPTKTRLFEKAIQCSRTAAGDGAHAGWKPPLPTASIVSPIARAVRGRGREGKGGGGRHLCLGGGRV